MDNCSLLVLVGPGVAVLVALGGLYAYFRPSRRPRLEYRTCQLADFGIPPGLLTELAFCPVFITLRSVGGTEATKIHVWATLSEPIESFHISGDCSGVSALSTCGKKFSLRDFSMNPKEEVNILLKCKAGVCQRVLLPQDRGVTFAHGVAKCVDY
jgi:hypothetical protein